MAELSQDFYDKTRDLTPEGVYQLAAEEARRPGAPGDKQRRLLTRLANLLQLGPDATRQVEDLAELKRSQGRLGKTRKFSRRQLYARAIRYAYWDGEPPEAVRSMLAALCEAVGYQDRDHERIMETLIDQGWAPPRPLPPRSEAAPESGEARRSGSGSREAREDMQEDSASPPGKEADLEGGSADGPLELETRNQAAVDAATLRKPGGGSLTSDSGAVNRTAPAPAGDPRVSSSRDISTSGEIRTGDEDLFETMSGLPQAKEDQRSAGSAAVRVGASLPTPPESSRLFLMGLMIGLLVAAVPTAFYLGSLSSSDPPAPSPPATSEGTPGKEPAPSSPIDRRPPRGETGDGTTVAASPRPEPSGPLPTAPPGPASSPDAEQGPGTPGALFLADLEVELTPRGGLRLLDALQRRLAEAGRAGEEALRRHRKERRRDLDIRFAERNESIFAASRDPARGGGRFEPELLEEALEEIRDVERSEELLPALAHAHFLTVLAFFVDPRRYSQDALVYQQLIPVLQLGLRTVPDLAESGSMIAMRVIAEDLRDGEDAALQALGLELLGELEH